jgi:hypothetical protein
MALPDKNGCQECPIGLRKQQPFDFQIPPHFVLVLLKTDYLIFAEKATTGPPGCPPCSKVNWNYDEDRSRKSYGPENISRLRRFAIGLIKSKGVRSIPRKMRKLTRNVRLVFDYLRMTANSYPQPAF